MANVTLDEQATKDLANLMVGMSQDKDFRPMVNKFLKKTSNKTLPDIEMEEVRESVRKEFEQRDQNTAKEKALAKLEAQREGLKDRYDDAAIGEIEKLMEKEGITSYATAAKLYAADVKPSMPTPDVKSGVFELPKFDIKNMGNIRKDAVKRGYEAVSDLMKRRATR